MDPTKMNPTPAPATPREGRSKASKLEQLQDDIVAMRAELDDLHRAVQEKDLENEKRRIQDQIDEAKKKLAK